MRQPLSTNSLPGVAKDYRKPALWLWAPTLSNGKRLHRDKWWGQAFGDGNTESTGNPARAPPRYQCLASGTPGESGINPIHSVSLIVLFVANPPEGIAKQQEVVVETRIRAHVLFSIRSLCAHLPT